MNSGSSLEPSVTVWYDGSCPLCETEIALFRRLDRRGRISFVDVSSEASVCPIDRGELLARFHAQEGDSALVSGVAAFAAMWRAIPVLRPFGEIARIPLALRSLETVYRQFLRVRPRLQVIVRRIQHQRRRDTER